MPDFVSNHAVLPKFCHSPQHLKGGPAAVVRLEVYPLARDCLLPFRNMLMPASIQFRGDGTIRTVERSVDLDFVWGKAQTLTKILA